jgi:hypothetical protein
MRRREFIAGLGATAWPLTAKAQQSERIRRVGVLRLQAGTDPTAATQLALFMQGLDELGWVNGMSSVIVSGKPDSLVMVAFKPGFHSIKWSLHFSMTPLRRSTLRCRQSFRRRRFFA